MLRLLFLESSRDFGGQEMRMLEIARGLDPADFQALIGARPDSYLYRERGTLGLDIRPLSMRNSLDLKGILGVLGLIRRERVDLLVTYSGKDSWIGLLAARLTGRPVIRMKNLELFKHRGSYNRVDRVVVPSAHLRAFLMARGVRGSQIEILAPGVDTRRFRFDPEARAELRHQYGIGPEQILLLYAAHFRGPKRQLLLVEALARHPDPRLRLMLLGEAGGQYGAQVRAAVAERGLAGRVLLPGRQGAVERYLSAADLFLFPSEQEAMPRALLEALACGLFVIASDIPPVREILGEPHLGTLFPPGDLAALGERLDQATAALDALVAQRARRHALVAEAYSAARMVRDFEDLCRRVVGARGA